jgi:hypothetical protein
MAKPSLETERRSQDEYRRRAALGDPDAQFYLAWDYFKGRLVAKDSDSDIISSAIRKNISATGALQHRQDEVSCRRR